MTYQMPSEKEIDDLVHRADHDDDRSVDCKRLYELLDHCRTEVMEATSCEAQTHSLFEIVPGEAVRECILYQRPCAGTRAVIIVGGPPL